MKTQDTCNPITCKPRVSLEQKVRILARKNRAAERRRRKREGKPDYRSGFRHVGAVALTFALLAAVAFSFTVQAANAGSAFEQANAAFASGNDRAAIAQYEAILAHDGCSAPVLFNLGNSYYRTGQFGEAILNYERAQVLAPRDSSITANLRLAREKATVPAPALNEVERAARILTPNTLAWIGSIALMMICLGIGVGRFLPRFSHSKVIVGVAAVTLLAVAASFAIRWPEFNRAIVITANATARIAPAGTAAESFELKAGEPVTIAKSYGQFVLARTSDGRSGWVARADLARVVPQSSDHSQSTNRT
jgi:tetratricopeptide (TPR) repeat protein